MYNFDFTSSCLFSIKHGKVSRVFAIGGQVGDVTMAIYADMDNSNVKRIRYVPPSDDSGEISEIAKGGAKNDQYGINVIGIETGISNDMGRKARGNIRMVRLRSVDDLIVAAIKRSSKNEGVPRIYSFPYNGKRVMAALELFEGFEGEEWEEALYYAFHEGRSAGFARYNYTENSVDFANVAGEHSYMYVKIINLAESLPFFRI